MDSCTNSATGYIQKIFIGLASLIVKSNWMRILYNNTPPQILTESWVITALFVFLFENCTVDLH